MTGELKMLVSPEFGIVIGVLSAMIAVVSLVFAWKAVRVAERNNFAGVYTELHKIYLAPATFNAIKIVWDVYSQYEESDTGTLISSEQAHELVRTIDQDSTEWKAIHEMSLFWKYVSTLVRKKYLDEEIAFEAFTSPSMLGLLAPIEQAFLEHYYGTVANNDKLPLQWLYWHRIKYIEDSVNG